MEEQVRVVVCTRTRLDETAIFLQRCSLLIVINVNKGLGKYVIFNDQMLRIFSLTIDNQCKHSGAL